MCNKVESLFNITLYSVRYIRHSPYVINEFRKTSVFVVDVHLVVREKYKPGSHLKNTELDTPTIALWA